MILKVRRVANTKMNKDENISAYNTYVFVCFHMDVYFQKIVLSIMNISA